MPIYFQNQSYLLADRDIKYVNMYWSCCGLEVKCEERNEIKKFLCSLPQQASTAKFKKVWWYSFTYKYKIILWNIYYIIPLKYFLMTQQKIFKFQQSIWLIKSSEETRYDKLVTLFVGATTFSIMTLSINYTA